MRAKLGREEPLLYNVEMTRRRRFKLKQTNKLNLQNVQTKVNIPAKRNGNTEHCYGAFRGNFLADDSCRLKKTELHDRL